MSLDIVYFFMFMTNVSLKCPQKAIIFARVSTSNQEAGHSLNAQVSRLQAYCKEKNLEVVKEFQISENSTIGNRKQFHEVIDFVKSQQESIVLVVDSIDRFQRGFQELALIDDLIKKDVIDIHFYKENFVLNANSSGTDILRWDMSVLLAKSYVSSLSDNIKKAFQYKRERM